MMDKEQLKKLKKISNNVSLNGAMSTHLKLSDLQFLIEQAERVEELEEEIEQEYSNHKDLEASLIKQNKRYREAIEKAKSKSVHRIGDSTMIKIYEILDEALEKSE